MSDWKDIPVIANVPVADELAAVREQLWRLKAREEELKNLILSNPDLCEGAHYLAEIKTSTQTRIDIKELKVCYPRIAEQFEFPQEITRVVLSGISEDGEITVIRHRRERQESQGTDA